MILGLHPSMDENMEQTFKVDFGANTKTWMSYIYNNIYICEREWRDVKDFGANTKIVYVPPLSQTADII